MKRLIVIGGGFAGFWSALSAVRQARTLGQPLEVTLVAREAYHTVRPRLYESDLSSVRWPLADYCGPLGIRLVVDEVVTIEPPARRITLASGGDLPPYDSLILAAGSRLRRPPLPGIEGAFDVDTFAGATALQTHLESLALEAPPEAASGSVVVVGGGFTGLEVVTELPGRLAALMPGRGDRKVHLVEREPALPFQVDAQGWNYVLRRLAELGVTLHLGRSVTEIAPRRVVLDDGSDIAAATVVWTGGLEATPLTRHFPGPRDEQGRLAVDDHLALAAHPEVFVAGDAARAATDDRHTAVMSCQHASPQGRVAGHNAACRLFGAELLTYRQPDYVTCLALGPGDALTTRGWERRTNKLGAVAGDVKRWIVTELIVPPRDAEAALAASLPPAPGGSAAVA